jgi:hypothetical protein
LNCDETRGKGKTPKKDDNDNGKGDGSGSAFDHEGYEVEHSSYEKIAYEALEIKDIVFDV